MLESKKVELNFYKSSIKKSFSDRSQLNEQYEKIRDELRNCESEMHRIESDLLYRTKKDYENMIK